MEKSSEICQEAGDIHYSVIYNVVLGFVILFNCFALALLINCGFFLLKTGKMCFNLRLLLLSLTVALIFRALITSYRAGSRIFHALTISNPCDFTASTFSCGIESSLQSLPFVVTLYSFPIIAVERLVATIFRNIYSKRSFCFLVCAGILANWSYVMYTHYTFLMSLQTFTQILPYCSTITNIDSLNFQDIFTDAQFIVPLVSLCICMGVYLFCKHKKNKFFKHRKISHSLTERYNLSEIIKTSQIVLILCSVFCLLYILYQIVLTISAVYFQVNTLRKFSVIKEISSLCVMPVFANAYGMAFLYLQKKASINLVSFAKHSTIENPNTTTNPHRKSRNFVSPLTTETDAYFNIYASSWK